MDSEKRDSKRREKERDGEQAREGEEGKRERLRGKISDEGKGRRDSMRKRHVRGGACRCCPSCCR